MGSISRYVFRTVFSAFILVAFTLTAIIWVTEALKGIDLMTSKGQTLAVVLGLTSLFIPILFLVTAPIALLAAATYTLNKLATDSEIIVMSASGMSPMRLFRPFLASGAVVALIVLLFAGFVAPESLRRFRDWSASITADVLTNVIQPGRFNTIAAGLTVHIRDRLPDGRLAGILLDDRRVPGNRDTIVAESGTTLQTENGIYLILEHGNLQRYEAGNLDPTLVGFERYAFDLSSLTRPPSARVYYSIPERYIWDLLTNDPDDPVRKEEPQKFLVDFFDRLAAPLYAIAFVVLAYAYLGAPRTTRESRVWSIGSLLAVVLTVRLAGFGFNVMAQKYPPAMAFQFILLAAIIGGSLWIIAKGIIIEPPASLVASVASLQRRLLRRAERAPA